MYVSSDSCASAIAPIGRPKAQSIIVAILSFFMAPPSCCCCPDFEWTGITAV